MGEKAQPRLRARTCLHWETVCQNDSVTVFLKCFLCQDEVGGLSFCVDCCRCLDLGHTLQFCNSKFTFVNPTFVPDHSILVYS